MMRDEMVKAFKLGWSLIPLKENSKLPNLPKGHEFLTRKPTNAEYKAFNWGNYGIVTGPVSGICVLDIDGLNGRRTLQELEIKPNLIETPQVLTPNGRHIYFNYNPGVMTGVAVLGKGVDIRSIGGYVVGPGSVVDGDSYVWDELFNADTPLAEPPEYMFKPQDRASRLSDWKIGATIGDGQRNNKLISLAGTLIARDLPNPVVVEMLRVVNVMLCKPPLDDEEVIHIAESAERYRH